MSAAKNKSPRRWSTRRWRSFASASTNSASAEPVITPTYPDRILVQIPGLDAAKIQEARDQLSRVAKLEFALVHPQNNQLITEIEAGRGIIPPDYKLITYTFDAGDKKKHRREIAGSPPADLTGEHITHAFAAYSQEWQVSLEFDSIGAKKFDELAAAHFHERFAILLDGVVQSAPSINAKYFGGRAQISGGRMGETEARNLSSVLENPLQTPVKIEEERQVSASLGSDSIRSGVYSAIAGIILVAVFMILYYRVVGFIAIVALLINCVMVLGAMAMFNSVLTLPGIAGLILSLGIAVDANVLIYERLREELDLGKSLKTAVDSSYGKAFSAIFDAHVTQFITAAILYWLATGPVKGFALTLTIGIVASMFSSLLITYTCFQWAFRGELDEARHHAASHSREKIRFPRQCATVHPHLNRVGRVEHRYVRIPRANAISAQTSRVVTFLFLRQIRNSRLIRSVPPLLTPVWKTARSSQNAWLTAI